MGGRKVRPEDRRRSAPMTSRAWHELLGTVLVEVNKHVIDGQYEGNMAALVQDVLDRKQLGSSPSAVMARLQMGGWLVYEGKQGGTSTWSIRNEHPTLDDVTRADYLLRREAKARQTTKRRDRQPPVTDQQPDGGQMTGTIPAMLAPGVSVTKQDKVEREGQAALDRSRPDPHDRCKRTIARLVGDVEMRDARITALEGRLAAAAPIGDVVSRETYDKDLHEMHERLDDAEAVITALMADPNTARLIRIATRVVRHLPAGETQ